MPGAFTFHITYWWPIGEHSKRPEPRVTLTGPADWTATPGQVEGTTGTFTVLGTPDRLRNGLTLQGQAANQRRQVEVVIPAPWLVAARAARELG